MQIVTLHIKILWEIRESSLQRTDLKHKFVTLLNPLKALLAEEAGCEERGGEALPPPDLDAA